MSYIIAFASIVFICETFFPSDTVYIQKEDGEVISYGVPKGSLLDESGMLTNEAIEKLGGVMIKENEN